MARVDPLLLVVAGGVAGQLEDLSGQVLHDGCQVDGSSCSHSFGVVALAEETVDSADWELETRAGRAALGFGAGFASFATSRHGGSVAMLGVYKRVVDVRAVMAVVYRLAGLLEGEPRITYQGIKTPPTNQNPATLNRNSCTL